MTPTPKICTIIGSNKGGVGKSMIALLQTMVYDNAGYPLRLVEIDNERKLSSLLGKRVDLAINAYAKLSDTSRSRHAAESFYNPVYQEMNKSDSLIDFGANVTTPFMEWFRQCDMGEFAAEDGISFRFVACAAPDELAISAAVTSVAMARSALGPTAEYFVVLNDTVGQSGYAVFDRNAEYVKLLDLERAGLVKIIRIEYCDSLLLEHGKAMNKTPVQIVNEYEAIGAAAGLDQISTRVHRLKLRRWIVDTQTAMEPMMLVGDTSGIARAG